MVLISILELEDMVVLHVNDKEKKSDSDRLLVNFCLKSLSRLWCQLLSYEDQKSQSHLGGNTLPFELLGL